MITSLNDPLTPNSTINKKSFDKKLSLNGTAGGLSSSDESRTRLMRFQLRTTVETVTINSNSKYKLTQFVIESLLFFCFSCLDFRNSESKPTFRLAFDNVCLIFGSSINRLTDFCNAGKRRISPSVIIQLLLAIFLRYYPSQKSKRFNCLTKLPE